MDKKVKQKLSYGKKHWPSNIDKYNRQEALLKDRGSMSKTDPDATFMRMKTQKKRIPLTRGLLGLLKKFINFEQSLRESHPITFNVAYYRRVATIKKIYTQQKAYFKTGAKIKDRMVSISKDYVRPIVRGKEIKSVEFGAKVNKLQIDGISFIEHISFNAFNEGTRLQSTIYKAQSLTHRKTRVLGADAFYATNKNRKYVTHHNIKTDFKRKGKLPKNYKAEKKLKVLITKERATRLEGSFGKEKEYYHLKKIKAKAKTKATEILWIFFGIHTANALEIGRRMYLAQQLAA
ncbi:transposase [uncultured Aquimarina sp.]|uniref:transposase n=1 Tax=uncultured Aquimarina sp. TaxID=575652 RepID=UPI002630BB4C|nr:transposase [uncultured Aquimarina sp.]